MSKWFKTLLPVLLATVSMLGLGSSAQADIFFQPLGNGSLVGATQITGLDQAPGQAVAIAANGLPVGSSFNVNFQSALSSFLLANPLGGQPAGLGTTYQITTAAHVTVTIVATLVSFPFQASVFGLGAG